MEYKTLGKLGATNQIEKEFGKLFTHEIIVTDEREKHIKDRHFEDYDLFQKCGKNTVNNPDCVIKDGKNNNTIFMIKHLSDTNLNVVVKVSIDKEHPDYKNSVITFYRIRDKNLEKLKKRTNNKILYIKE